MGGLNTMLIQGLLNIGFTLLMIGAAVVIVSQAVTRWLAPRPAAQRAAAEKVEQQVH